MTLNYAYKYIMQQISLFDKTTPFFYPIVMFVSVVLDPSGVDSAKIASEILTRFGFKKVQRACWENMQASENQIAVLKRELDMATDYYDSIRIYQFPCGGNFVVTELKQKKWRKAVFSSSQPETRT